VTSIVLTVHNKDWLIEKVLRGIFENSNETRCELILVFDGCSDSSEEVALNFCKIHKPGNFSLKTVYTPDVFETKANNAGARIATGDSIMIVQDDMVVKEDGWITRMQKPIKEFSDVFAVTARTAHNWVYNINTVHENISDDLDNCWCDILHHVDHADRRNTPREVFAIRESVNRGPLLLRHDILEKMNYFDERFSPQDMDDHDLCYRTSKLLGLRSGCYWIDFESQDDWGGTRVSGSTAPWVLKANHKNMKIVWSRHRDIILGPKTLEQRNLK